VAGSMTTYFRVAPRILPLAVMIAGAGADHRRGFSEL